MSEAKSLIDAYGIELNQQRTAMRKTGKRLIQLSQTIRRLEKLRTASIALRHADGTNENGLIAAQAIFDEALADYYRFMNR